MPVPSKLALATGVATYGYLFRRPMRGDIWLALEILGAIGVFLTKRRKRGGSILSALSSTAKAVSCHVAALIASAVLYRLSPLHPLAKFPGPLINRITSLRLVQIVASGKRYEIINDLHKRYGAVVRTGPNTISLNSHDAILPIYASASAWDKSDAYQLGLIPGTGLFFIRDRKSHDYRRRHYWAPSLTNDALTSYTPMLNRRTNDFLETLANRREGGIVDVSLALNHWTHDVTGELVFGDSYQENFCKNGDREGMVDSALAETIVFEVLGEAPSLFNVLWWFPTTKALRTMDDCAEVALKQRRRMGSQARDMMTYLLSEAPSPAPKLPDTHLRQEAIIAVQAGTNGISAAITFAFFFLASNPEIYAKLKTELMDFFPDFDGSETFDGKTVEKLPYLNAVAEESLRLGAPLGSFPRIAPKGGAYIAEQYIPEGTIVGVPAWAQMISEDNFYPHPESFIPERWLPGCLGSDSRCNRNAIMTFSHGPFGCMGKQFAHLEMRLVLAKTLLRYDFKLAPDFDSTKFLAGVKNMRVTSFGYPLRLQVVP